MADVVPRPIEARDPRAEARVVVGDDHDARVLEPSPPAVATPPFADDPAARDGQRSGTVLLTPSDGSWQGWVDAHPRHRDWAADRWLAAHRRLGPAPPGLAATRAAVHDLATHVLTPARYRATGRIGLRWTLGGIGTPFFGEDEQVRLEGDRLVVQRGARATSHPLRTIAHCCEATIGVPEPDLGWLDDLDLHDPPAACDPSAELAVDPDVVGLLGDWYGFAHAVLERLRGDDASVEASPPQLWPEHLDVAIEVLPGRRRASYGFSPGDAATPEPYVYVGPWELGADDLDGPMWDASGFAGASLGLGALQEVDDQFAHVLAWLRERRDALALLPG